MSNNQLNDLPKKSVYSSCVDYLNMEIAHYVINEDIPDEQKALKLEKLGYNVGERLIERYTKHKRLFHEDLDIIKFICKDFWTLVFSKQIDNLLTNHKGIFVLTDKKFRWLIHVSPIRPVDPNEQTDDTINEQEFYSMFPCGLIRGALTNLGLSCTVSADIKDLPTCVFTIKISK
eukprot:TRINITY_DN977_c0_g1_i1.p1 TRINITY_DN977_c0_g1~~TRINITY_DN977_c0_g1_i1.p1  ORF type:complete len:175 (+),score=22.38 TRINITY_DN977_c0_g1_i1:172-696(+)